MSWKRYNTKVRVGPSSGGVVLPVTDLEVFAEPYTGSGETVVTLFDGRRRMEPTTWGYRIELAWAELRSDQAALQSAIVYLRTHDGADLYLDFDDDTQTFSGSKVIPQVIPLLSGGEITAQFVQRARKRPGRLTLVTKSQHEAFYTWLTE